MRTTCGGNIVVCSVTVCLLVDLCLGSGQLGKEVGWFFVEYAVKVLIDVIDTIMISCKPELSNKIEIKNGISLRFVAINSENVVPNDTSCVYPPFWLQFSAQYSHLTSICSHQHHLYNALLYHFSKVIANISYF